MYIRGTFNLAEKNLHRNACVRRKHEAKMLLLDQPLINAICQYILSLAARIYIILTAKKKLELRASPKNKNTQQNNPPHIPPNNYIPNRWSAPQHRHTNIWGKPFLYICMGLACHKKKTVIYHASLRYTTRPSIAFSRQTIVDKTNQKELHNRARPYCTINR